MNTRRDVRCVNDPSWWDAWKVRRASSGLVHLKNISTTTNGHLQWAAEDGGVAMKRKVRAHFGEECAVAAEVAPPDDEGDVRGSG